VPDGFLELAAEVYANEPMWVPEPPESVATKFSSSNPWFDTGTSRVFCIPGAARLAAFVSPLAQVDGKPAAFFGYWETHGETKADDAIFAAAEAWARDQGAEAIFGPINFNTYGRYRLRTSCEPDGSTFAGEPFNPTSYPPILERQGFSEARRAVTQLAPASLAAVVAKARRPLLDKVLDAGFTVEALSHQLWLDNIKELHGLVDEMFSANFAYTSLSLEDFTRMCGRAWIGITCPKTSVIAFDPSGAIAGFFLTYPHYGPLIVQGAGERRVSTAELNYDEHFPLLAAMGKVDAVSKTVATVPALRNQGVMTALTISLFERGEGIYERYYGALIGEDNYNRRYGDKLAVDARWYAVYQKALK
jgi:GNAT superfamily N-acetyltransferase